MKSKRTTEDSEISINFKGAHRCTLNFMEKTKKLKLNTDYVEDTPI